MNNNFQPICMTEEFWANSYLSVARHMGRVMLNGHVYVIVNKEGRDIFELSAKAEKEGRDKAIEPGEPADLCRIDFVPLYRRLGREKFLEILKDNPHTEDKELKKIMKEAKR